MLDYLAPWSKTCVFLRYSLNYKCYKCLDPDTGKVYLSRHVTFDESNFPFKSSSTVSSTVSPAPSSFPFCAWLFPTLPFIFGPHPSSSDNPTILPNTIFIAPGFHPLFPFLFPPLPLPLLLPILSPLLLLHLFSLIVLSPTSLIVSNLTRQHLFLPVPLHLFLPTQLFRLVLNHLVMFHLQTSTL